ncbi:MAG: hypothetical protein VX617_05430 [Pseudomonadota bacterium]|nr:hypothetical protein [Pseudomonadota bacterium]
MNDGLQPDFERRPNNKDILNSYRTAEEALSAGNYYAALLKARTENIPDIESAALIMCGEFDRGLDNLGPGTHPHEIYGQWCLKGKDAAISSLKNFDGFEQLRVMLNKPIINIFVLCGPHTKNGVPSNNLSEFNIQSVLVERDKKISTLSEIMPHGFHPDLILILDIYGHRLPDDLYDFQGPLVFLTFDFDFQLPHQYQDLDRAHLIIGNSAYEHYFLDKIYSCPITCGLNWYLYHSIFSTNTSDFAPKNLEKLVNEKTFDILHTGLSFTPIMREKAQFLFRIATLDNPDLNIRIHHGFLERDEYLSHVQQAKFSPIFNSRMYGGLQTRTIDAICNGSIVLHGGGDMAVDLFEDCRGLVNLCPSSNLEDDIAGHLAAYPQTSQKLAQKQQTISGKLRKLFLSPKERSDRFLKYCLFELARNNFQPVSNRSLRTTSAFGLSQCLNLARKDDANAHGLYSLTLFKAIDLALKKPSDKKCHETVESVFLEANSAFPQSLVLNFNFARFQWMVGKKDESFDIFSRRSKGLYSYKFEPKSDLTWLKFFKDPSEMMPAQDYFTVLSKDLALQDQKAKKTRNIIGATALSYMALYQLQYNKIDDGLTYLDEALGLYPDHFPAARLRFKALHAKGKDWEAVIKAFQLAVKLYPPCLTELLPFGVSAELAQDNQSRALSLVKTWVYFITRCTWEKQSNCKIPQNTWKTVRAFFDQLPNGLQAKLKKKFPKAVN